MHTLVYPMVLQLTLWIFYMLCCNLGEEMAQPLLRAQEKSQGTVLGKMQAISKVSNMSSSVKAVSN